MSQHQFILDIKSTLDFEAKRIADSLALPFVDLAAESFDSDVLESDEPAIVWDFSSLMEDPQDPMYTVMFDLGVMTFMDPAQYVGLGLIGKFQNAFTVGSRFVVKDYSGDNLPSVSTGTLMVTAISLTPQQADRATGLRFVSVTAKAIRNV
jgi:hypothetical protein